MSTDPAGPRRPWLVQYGPRLAGVALLGLFLLLLAWQGELGSFFQLGSLRVLLYNNTVQGVAALAMLLVIISGGIDLSIGSVVALVAVVMIQTYRLVGGGPELVLPSSLIGWLRDR